MDWEGVKAVAFILAHASKKQIDPKQQEKLLQEFKENVKKTTGVSLRPSRHQQIKENHLHHSSVSALQKKENPTEKKKAEISLLKSARLASLISRQSIDY